MIITTLTIKGMNMFHMKKEYGMLIQRSFEATFFLFKFPKFKNEMDQLKNDGKIPVEIDERNLIKICHVKITSS